MSDLLMLAASAAVVLLLVAVAAMLGFRQRARLDATELARLAASEGAHIESMVFDTDGTSALARLTGGKVLIARVMGDGVSARVIAADGLKLRLAGGLMRVVFADLGFAPLRLKLRGEAPDWLHAIAGGKHA